MKTIELRYYKPTKCLCAKQRLRPVWSETSLCDQWVAKDQSFLYADSESSLDAHAILLVLSWGGLLLHCYLYAVTMLIWKLRGTLSQFVSFSSRGNLCNVLHLLWKYQMHSPAQMKYITIHSYVVSIRHNILDWYMLMMMILVLR